MSTQSDFRTIYDRWFGEVSRWARALGAREAERDDVVQDVFIIVRRRLSSFDGQNMAGWLYQITRRCVKDARHRYWVKHIFTRRRMNEPDELPALAEGPAAEYEKKERQRVLFSILDKMPMDLRVAFVLFEIEGRSGEEIAAIQGISSNTVYSRLHHARKLFAKLVARYKNIKYRDLTGGNA